MATSPSGLNFTVDPRTIATPDDLAVALSALRARAALTVRDLARRADIPSSTVGGYLSGRHLPPPTQPDLVARLLLALSVPADQHDEWLDALWRVRSWRRGPGADQRAPFLGLRAFDRPDADLFFGRATETAALAAMVRGSAGALLAVVGPSGSGKTSLIRAGLCAALPADWVVAVQTPRADPVGAVAALREAAQAPRTSPDTHCVVVLDQAEELWTLAPDAAARTRAVADLATLTSDPTTHVVVGLRSDFFTEAAAEPALLAALQTHQFVLGSPGRDALAETVTGPAAEFGIPIAPGLVDLIVDDAVSGAAGRSAVLPHLSHTLAMMWEHAVRRELSAESYQAVGRVAGAVAQSAEAAYAELAPEQRKLARALLLRLVVVEEGLPPTSAVVPVADLPEEHLEVLRHFTARRLIVADSDTVRFSHEAVLSAWSDLARWVAEDRQTLALHRTVSREARAWAEADHDPSLLLRGSRLAAVRDWPTGLRLAPGPVVTDFLEASRRAEDDAAERARRVHRRTRRLLAGSSVLAAATAVTAAGLIASRVTIASERDQARSRQIAAESRAFAASDVALAHRLAVAAFDTDDTVQARSQLTVSTADPAMTTIDGPVGPVMVATHAGRGLLALAGTAPTVRLFDTTSPVPRLVGTVPAPTTSEPSPSVFALAFSPDGHLLALGGTAGRVEIVDISDPKAPAPLGTALTIAPEPGTGADTTYALSFTADGRELLAAGPTGISRWSLANPSAPVPEPTLATDGYATTLALLADGTVVTGTDSGQVALFDPARPQQPMAAATVDGYVTWVSGSGTEIAVATRRGGATYRATVTGATGAHRLTPMAAMTSFDSWANWVVPGPDGQWLVGSSARTARVIGTDNEVRDEFPVPDAVTSLAWLPDGRMVVGAVSGTTYVRGAHPLAADDVAGRVFFATWDGTGSRLATFPYSPGSSQVRIWDTSEPGAPSLIGRPVATLPESAGPLNGSGDLSPSGRLVVAGTLEGTVVGWDISTPASPRQLFAAPLASANVEYVGFVSENRLLLASDDQKVRVIELPTAGGATAGSSGGTTTGPSAGPTVVATLVGSPKEVTNADLSPAGTLVAATSYDGATRLYRMGTGTLQPLATIPGDGYAYATQFTPDGRFLAVGGESKAVLVYDISSPDRPVLVDTLTGAGSAIYSLDVAADGRIAAAALDGGAYVWAPRSGGPAAGYDVALRLVGGAGLYGVEWSPDGTRLAAVGQRARLSIWTTDPAAARETLCAAEGDPMTARQWSAALPDLEFTRPCS